jgi:hypothetical protein
MMIGSGTPRIHNNAPLPKPMTSSFEQSWRFNADSLSSFQKLATAFPERLNLYVGMPPFTPMGTKNSHSALQASNVIAEIS